MNPTCSPVAFQAYWDAGYHIHVHNNGDARMDVLVANLEQAMRRNPRFDHRTTVVHFGFATPQQVDKLKALGAIVSANPYYVTALGASTPRSVLDRSVRQTWFRSVMWMRNGGMSISFHSDMPMAPAKPMQLMLVRCQSHYSRRAGSRTTAQGGCGDGVESRDDQRCILHPAGK